MARQERLDQPIDIVINLGPLSDPANASEFNSDGNVYARITAAGHVRNPDAVYEYEAIKPGSATYDSLHRQPPWYRPGYGVPSLVSEVTITTFLRSADDPTVVTAAPVTEVYSRNRILGEEDWYRSVRGLTNRDQEEAYIATGERRVAGFEADAAGTLALLYDRARNATLNPVLAPIVAARAPLEDAA